MQSITKLLAVACLFATSVFGYTYNRSFTTDHTKVITSNKANFAILISGTYDGSGALVPDWRTTGNGGKIQNTVSYNSQTVPADLKFTSDSGGTTLLSWEVASYSASTGAIEIWVKIPNLLTASDVIIYAFYGDAAVTTYQGGSVGAAWDSNYVLVAHLANGSSLSPNDSTSNAYSGTVAGPSAGTGQIDGAGVFAQNATRIFFPSNADTSATVFTAEVWVFETADPNSVNGACVMCKWTGLGWMLFLQGSTGTVNAIQVYLNGTPFNTGAILTKNVWTHIVVTFDGSNVNVYVNGGTPAPGTGTVTGNSQVMEVGTYLSAINTGVTGNIDEVRFSKSVRDAAWITTEYNNQSSPATFYTIGPEQGGNTTHRTTTIIIQ